MASKCQISKGFVTSNKNSKNKLESSIRRSPWGMNEIYAEVNHWVHAFDRKFAR